MKINQEGLDLIKRNEGCRLTAYKDVIGILTIGYGHTGAEAKEGVTITQAQADNLLKADLSKFETGITDLMEVPINENQFSALVSLAFNIGLGALSKSGLLNKLNNGDYKGCADSFPRWNKAGGRVVKGLIRRREEERQLFEKPVASFAC